MSSSKKTNFRGRRCGPPRGVAPRHGNAEWFHPPLHRRPYHLPGARQVQFIHGFLPYFLVLYRVHAKNFCTHSEVQLSSAWADPSRCLYPWWTDPCVCLGVAASSQLLSLPIDWRPPNMANHKDNPVRWSSLCNRPWRPIGWWDVEIPTFCSQSAHRWRWGKVKLSLEYAMEAHRVVRCRGSTFCSQSAHRWRWECQPYAPAALYPQEDSWYLEAESATGL
jgi:hypothetical protein